MMYQKISSFFTGIHIYETENNVTMDTKLEIPISSGSVLETAPMSWPLTQGTKSITQ